MSKSKKKKDFSNEGSVANRPFEGLSALREALPAGEAREPLHRAADDAQQTSDDWKSAQIVLQREKKGRGGKTVVRVKGLTLNANELADLLKKIKTDVGCGGTIDEGEALILGDVSERLLAWFNKNGANRVKRGN